MKQASDQAGEETAQPSAGTLSDQELMQLCQTQPAVGIAALYDRYGRLVFSVALRVLGDRELAEEITQDVFVSCWRHADRFEAERGNLMTWLLRVTRNRAIDELRSRRYKQQQLEIKIGDERATSRHTSDREDQRLLRATVRDALTDLPPAQREVIELLFFWGFSRQEAAAHLQSPLGTIHTRLRLGIAKLRQALADVLDESV